MAVMIIGSTCVVLQGTPAQGVGSFTFGAVGDHGSSANARTVLRAVGAADPDFFLSLGDLSYDTIRPSSWCQMVQDELNLGSGRPAGDPYGETYPFELVEGNHDVPTFDQYIAPSCLPDRLNTTVSPSGTYGREYFVDYPAGAPLARFIVAAPGLDYSYSAGSAHYQWVSDTIDSARSAGIRWVIVSNHLNYISTGTKLDEIGSDYFNLLISKRVDLILQGHDHTYQRSKQLGLSAACPAVPTGVYDQDCVSDDGADGSYAKGSGAVLVITGTGGQPNYAINSADPETGYFARSRGLEQRGVFGYTSFTVSETTLAASFTSVAGASFSDAFTIAGDPVPDTSPPSVVPGVVGVADGSGSRVDLSWGAASDDRGVAGYQVVRDGVVIAPGVTGTGYADSTVSAGTTYQYVVRAFDAAGNVGPDSAVVTVTTPDPPAAVLAETWPGADGSPWPTVWSSTAGSGGAVQTVSGGGRLSLGSTAGSYARSTAAGVEPLDDADVVTSYQWSATSPSGLFGVYLRGSGGWQNPYRPTNGYGLVLTPDSSTISVLRNVNGTKTTLAYVPNAAQVSTTKQWLRFSVDGQQLSFRTWPDGQPEPTTWTWTGTDTTISAPGRLFTSLVRGGATTTAKSITLDDLTLTRSS